MQAVKESKYKDHYYCAMHNIIMHSSYVYTTVQTITHNTGIQSMVALEKCRSTDMSTIVWHRESNYKDN